MNTRRLQRSLDQLLATTGQRLLLSSVAVGAVVVASAMVARSTSFADTWVVVVVAVLALVVAVEPDEHLGAIVIAIVVAQWLSLGQAPTSPWSLAIAGSIFTFHTLVALMAVTPHTSVIGRAVMQRWIAPAVGALGTWFVVVALDRRNAPGSVALSVTAFAVLAAAIVAFRARTSQRSTDADGDDPDQHDAQPQRLAH